MIKQDQDSVQEALDSLEELTQDFNMLRDILTSDLLEIKKRLNEEDKQVWRRFYIKTIFSLIDARIHMLKSHIIATRKMDYLPIEEFEESILYRHVKDGNKRKPGHHISFTDNLVFILELFAEANYTSKKYEKNTKEWNYLINSTKIRNRITHPKISSEMMVTDKEMETCKNAFLHFENDVTSLLKLCSKNLIKQANGLRKQMKLLK